MAKLDIATPPENQLCKKHHQNRRTAKDMFVRCGLFIIQICAFCFVLVFTFDDFSFDGTI